MYKFLDGVWKPWCGPCAHIGYALASTGSHTDGFWSKYEILHGPSRYLLHEGLRVNKGCSLLLQGLGFRGFIIRDFAGFRRGVGGVLWS